MWRLHSPSYTQPAFTLADQNRVRQSHRLLQATMEDTRKANLRLVTARERSSQLGKEVGALDARIAALSLELENKRTVLKAATEEVEDMAARIEYNLDKRNGLCIRYTLAALVCSYKCYIQLFQFLGVLSTCRQIY